ncbi:MAG TPA: DoxX family protein [Gemmataceae bacterium]|nr:DoxX family protein [Gemmataceae bacterium]
MLNRHRWVFLVIRLVLALVFIVYGAMKLLWLQLATGDLSGLRFGEASPMMVTWHFFSLSPLYHHAIGVAEIVTGLLLIVPRTAAVGALCFLVIILNIVLINFGYDIALDVKTLSCVLLALDGVLLVHYRRRYRLLLVSDAVFDELLKTRPGDVDRGQEFGRTTGHRSGKQVPDKWGRCTKTVPPPKSEGQGATE